MITIAKAVIGAGFGDEGKGLMTDFLAAENSGAVVVRTNGGAQAGHTVVTPEGIRHVFHHVGSGALAGARTHLSRFFVSHPMFFLSEVEKLRRIGANTNVTIDPRALVTTPYDIMVNQIIESRRGDVRHGSCGMGFGETIERSSKRFFKITVADLGKDLRVILIRIRSQWVSRRLRKLGVEELTDEEIDLIFDDGILESFVTDCARFVELVRIRDDADIGREGTVIFEGAQGLMLDQDYGAFPHVTRSNTGMPNIAAVCAEAGISSVDVHYMTRAYSTRHGAGPLRNETKSLKGVEVVDETNTPNDWQGELRLAPLDVDGIVHAINYDLWRVKHRIEVRPGIFITCTDQIHGDTLPIEVSGRIFPENKISFLSEYTRDWHPHGLYGVSDGPTRENVKMSMLRQRELRRDKELA
ncbi:adenylosuccinate synthetase [Roseibium sp. Sym1]|uniref:adenylosuccinate synthetase n=1 Tax=Roseibium sp. Sym1 TaxID=3016006 RepID=UPI0022B375BA|nr:adenylosuccinate synthetase [Roseibium sp. Sym1]